MWETINKTKSKLIIQTLGLKVGFSEEPPKFSELT